MTEFPDSAHEKQTLRREARARRATLDLPTLSVAVAAQIAALPEFLAAQHVLLYLASDQEIDLEALATRTPDKAWYAPRCVAKRALAIHPFRAGVTPLRVGAYGLREPDPAHAPPLTDLALLDLVLVPGLLFTPTGYRLGHGGGYYDRFLPRLREDCLTVGVCCEAALVAHLPHDSWDRRMDLVATERKVYDARPR